MKTLTNQAFELYYEGFGESCHPAIVLIPGLGSQGISWSQEFCTELAQHGFYVLRVDNRDSGRSFIFDDTIKPDLQAMQRGEMTDIPYTLSHMADDIAATLNAAQITKAHIIGRSLGGIIAQIFAANHSDRVLSLGVIMSTTGNPELPAPKETVMSMLFAPKPDALKNREAYITDSLSFFKCLSGQKLSFDEAYYRQYIEASIDRSHTPTGTLRQIAAMAATGDIRAIIKNIKATTLIIHGSDDPMFSVEAAYDIQQHINQAQLKLIDGMGHEIPPKLNEQVIRCICRHQLGEVNLSLG